MTYLGYGVCNKCQTQYPLAPPGSIHKCGRCEGGMVVDPNQNIAIPEDLLRPNILQTDKITIEQINVMFHRNSDIARDITTILSEDSSPFSATNKIIEMIRHKFGLGLINLNQSEFSFKE